MSARGLAAALVLLFAGAAAAAEPELRIEPLASPVKVRLRGLSAFSDSIAWASGREGTVLRTIDGGAHWDVFKVPGAETLDFRDVHAFGADVALVMGAGPGDASRVYRTADGGHSWTLALRNPDAEGFFDCMDFSGEEGRLLGDPVKGRFQVFASNDGGRSWRWTKGPKAEKDEAAFAASGTCLARVSRGTVVVTGGARSRALYLPDRFEAKGDWHALPVEAQPSPSTGLFSVAVRDRDLVAVGGDYKAEAAPGLLFSFSAVDGVERSHSVCDGPQYLSNRGNDQLLQRVCIARRWEGAEFRPWREFTGSVSAYRSGVACDRQFRESCVATGPDSTDILIWPEEQDFSPLTPEQIDACRPHGPRCNYLEVFGAESAPSWKRILGIGYDSVAIAGNVAWFSGDEGRLGRMTLPAPHR